MNNERPFENIVPIQNIKVGYFEKEEYLKIIDRQEKQIQSFGVQIMALQSRIDVLEKNKIPKYEWIRLDLAKRVIAKFKGYLDEDMIERIQIALEKENEADMKGGTE